MVRASVARMRRGVIRATDYKVDDTIFMMTTIMVNQYLSDTKHAATTLIDLIYSEEEKLVQLRPAYEEAKKILEPLAHHFLSIDLQEDWNEREVTNAHILYATNAAKYPDHKVYIEIHSQWLNKKNSLQALAGALLQIARQCIAEKGSLSSAREGRFLTDGICTRDLVWHARNQSMHYEEVLNRKKDSYKYFRNNLARKWGPKFDPEGLKGRNLAKEIIDRLGWTNCGQYEADMILVLST